MNWAGFSAVGAVVASFFDIETADGNVFAASALDFSLDSGDWSPAERADDLSPGTGAVTRHMSVHSEGSLSFQYNIKTVKTDGDDAFCAALHLVAKREDVSLYDGALMSLAIAPPAVIDEDSVDDWTFEVDLPSGADAFPDKACEFRFDVDGWQIGFADGSSGFSDHEELENILEGAPVVGEAGIDRISPIADSFVDQDDGDDNDGSSGDLKVRSKSGRNNRRAFIRFDFHFPTDTTIDSALLKLLLDDAPSSSRTYGLSLAASLWTEMGITWNNQPATSSPAVTSFVTGTDDDTWFSFDVKSDVVGFVDGTLSNYGWSIYDTKENSTTSRESKFASRTHGDENERPFLEIAFTAPPATTTHMVVNEVYYDVGDGKGSEGTNEWVELYNPTDTAIDIKDWQVCDAGGSCDTLATTSPSILVPSHGFAVITPNVSTWTKWLLPASAVKIVITPPSTSNIGGGLANDGDAVVLKNASSTVIDAMSYGDDVSELNPAVPGGPKGTSVARIVKGYDANSANDWVINAMPNPGTNPSDGGSEVMRFMSDGIEVAATLSDLPELATGEVVVDAGVVPTDVIAPEDVVENIVVSEDVVAPENVVVSEDASTTVAVSQDATVSLPEDSIASSTDDGVINATTTPAKEEEPIDVPAEIRNDGSAPEPEPVSEPVEVSLTDSSEASTLELTPPETEPAIIEEPAIIPETISEQEPV